MEFNEVLRQRGMVRNYADEPVDPEVLRDVAAAAFRAPSAGNSQGFAVVVVTNPETRLQIAALADEAEYVARGFDPWISTAPAHIILSVSEKTYHDRYQEPDKVDNQGREVEWPVPYWWIDAGAALMAVLLAAIDKGLAAGFLGVHSIPDLKVLLKIPEHFSPIGVITVGHRAEDRKSESLARGKKPLAKLLHFERFDSHTE